MAEEMVQTKHPLGKRNKPVSKQDYELFKAAIVAVLQDRAPTHTELIAQVTRDLKGKFDGNVSWHTMTVKLDLEAQRIIERTLSKPQRYRLT